MVGNKGMLGTEVERLLREGLPGDLQVGGFDYAATDLDVDITSPDAVRAFIEEHNADWIINCAAYTAVDKAEEEEELARRINADGPENLARAIAGRGRLIHVSTDYVFDGTATAPIPEDTPPHPLGAYGRTKAEGERRIAAATDAYFIVRTAWLYGVHGKNFVGTMQRLMAERDEICVVVDQYGSPTYAVDLAEALVRLVACDCREYGAYHFTNAGETSWHGFALAIREIATERGILRKECEVTPIPSSEYPTPAKRPAYSVLATDRIARVTRMRIPHWRDGLGRYLEQLEKEQR